ncbi:tetratricopeptide repeat protein [Marinoscillum furvescens]|uniref:Tetratricopeptide repeat protein n=1 Tax=Marinoscillum furvescens DSM 4134 TaxID=1122208 RepID=A0A3D9L2R5_MARFU|nr:tetratricopeptide repeat protein [Marinoscillum furvescens]RED97989.1 hypothetical protein C7460_111130 [Marinoscillum furvescens DSM 4134]
MNQDRINQLKKFIEEDPNDPFPKYALALEHLKDNKTISRQLFEELLEKHPDYLGTYYHAAALFAELDEFDIAEDIYKRGIDQAKNQKDAHSLKELQSAYLNFQFEN